MSIKDILSASSIKEANQLLTAENASLKTELGEVRALLTEIGGNDTERAKAKTREYEVQSKTLKGEIELLRKMRDDTQKRIEQKRGELVVVEDELLLESFALYKPKFAMTNSAEYKERLEKLRDHQKALIKAGQAVRANENWTVNGSESEGKKMVADMKKLLLRSFNNECDYCVDNVKFSNIATFEKRIEKSFDALKKLGRIINAEVMLQYKERKLDELHLAHEYQLAKQREREEQHKARALLREQQKLEQEIREARERIAKERKHFAAAIAQLESKMAACASVDERADIERRLAEIAEQAMQLDKAEKEVDYREMNAKAGYVYVISNIGAFGEKVFKIGMTRRLEPTERVDELSDASVPFDFDIHALIFSDDAPSLEAKLHGHFESSRINKINKRREFFRAELVEIESVIRENYDKVFDLIREAPAEQYRESLRL